MPGTMFKHCLKIVQTLDSSKRFNQGSEKMMKPEVVVRGQFSEMHACKRAGGYH